MVSLPVIVGRRAAAQARPGGQDVPKPKATLGSFEVWSELVGGRRQLESIHDICHSFASCGLLFGEGLTMIGKLLGHNKVQTTARYALLADNPIKSAANRIAEVAG